MPRVQAKMRLAESEFALAMTLLFALSRAGASTRAWRRSSARSWRAWRFRRQSSERVSDLTHGVAELLVPFFLVGIGLHFDLSAFSERSTLRWQVISGGSRDFQIGGVRTRRAAAWGGRTLRVGVGMVPRGEVGMVVAQIGLSMGVIGTNIYGIIVFMSVATTLIAPPLLKLAFGSPTEVEQEIIRQG